MSKRRHTDEEIFAVCEGLRAAEQAATVRRVYPIVGGNRSRIARLVAAFNRLHDPLAQMTRAYEEAIHQVQALTIKNSELRHEQHGLKKLVEEYRAKLTESDDNAVRMLQAAIDGQAYDANKEQVVRFGGS
jgi:hypothetical protein